MDLRPDFMSQAQRLQGRIDAGTEVNFSDFTVDHLEDREAQQMVDAIAAAKSFVRDIGETEIARAMILIAYETGDPERTGYGCGKTMLSKAIHYSNAFIRTIGPEGAGVDDMLAVKIARGSFYEARHVMEVFSGGDEFKPSVAFAEFGNLVVIDDVGREGMLRYIKGDSATQLQEKRDRYYSIIDYCYQTKKSIVITSNLASNELSEFLGGASWSRLYQMASPQYRINLTGVKDMRAVLGGF